MDIHLYTCVCVLDDAVEAIVTVASSFEVDYTNNEEEWEESFISDVCMAVYETNGVCDFVVISNVEEGDSFGGGSSSIVVDLYFTGDERDGSEFFCFLFLILSFL